MLLAVTTCSGLSLEYECAAAGGWNLGAELLQAESLHGGEAEGGAGRAGQPAVVHAALEALVLALPLPPSPLCLLQLPAQLQHQRFRDHLGRMPPGGPVEGLAPAEPGGHVLRHNPRQSRAITAKSTTVRKWKNILEGLN